MNSGYNSANANPYFWGWKPFTTLATDLFYYIWVNNLTMEEFDYYQEVNLTQYTVQARMIYDNMHNFDGTTGGAFDVLTNLRNSASEYGFDPNAVTMSTAANSVSSAGYDCGSVYGDSARIIGESSLIGTLAGGDSAFGIPAGYRYINGLICGGTVGTAPTGMISLPVSYSTPDMTDIHAYPCLLSAPGGSCDASVNVQSEAAITYSDLWWFLYYRNLTGNTATIGETHSNQNCDGFTSSMASQNVAGYEASHLYSNAAGQTVMRPWENDADVSRPACYVTPYLIGAPNGPYAP